MILLHKQYDDAHTESVVQSHEFIPKLMLEELLFLVLNYSDACVVEVGKLSVLVSDQINLMHVNKNKHYRLLR